MSEPTDIAQADIAAADPAEQIPPSRRCFRCQHWGDGIHDKEDTWTWRVCKVDGLNWFANRNYACAAHGKALTLRTAVQAAMRQMELI